MAQYYYLISGLSELDLEQTKMPFSLVDFIALLQGTLTQSDYRELAFLLLQYDNTNLLNLLQKTEKPFRAEGLFLAEELEELASTKEIEPEPSPADFYSYLRNFVIHFKNELPLQEGVRWENQLTGYYHRFVLQNAENAFLKEWIMFHQNLTNLDVAFTARNHGIEIEPELVGNNEVTSAILNTKTKDYGLSQEYPYAGSLVNWYEGENLYNREKQIAWLCWNKLNEMTTFNYFSLEQVLAYFIKLQMLDRWTQLDADRGRTAFYHILENLQTSYEFPKEFT